MVEFPRSVPNLTEASTNLYELLKGRNLVAYPDTRYARSPSRPPAQVRQFVIRQGHPPALRQVPPDRVVDRLSAWRPQCRGPGPDLDPRRHRVAVLLERRHQHLFAVLVLVI